MPGIQEMQETKGDKTSNGKRGILVMYASQQGRAVYRF